MRTLENSIALYTILRKEIVRFFRIWTQTLLPPVISMGLYFIIFGKLIGPRIGSIEGFPYIEFIVPGLIMMAMITNSYANVVGSFFSAKFLRNIEEMLVTPTPVSVILWGYLLGGVARGMVVGILVIIVAQFFTHLPLNNLFIIFFVGILITLLFSLAGFINAIYSKKFDDINIIPTFVLTPLTYLGGVFYSLSFISPLAQRFTELNPVFYMVNAFRYGLIGYTDANLTVAFVVIMGFVVVLYGIAIWLLKKGVGLRT